MNRVGVLNKGIIMASEKTKPLDTVALHGSVSKGSLFSQCTPKGSIEQTITHCNTNANGTGAKSAPLGIVTKTSSPRAVTGSVDTSTGEIISDKKRDHQSARADRWAFKSVVNKILFGSRTSKCMVYRAPMAGQSLSEIQVLKGANVNRAFYQGLMACGSIWTCPVCAAKISERRRVELSSALDVAKEKQMGIHFVTLTFPHGVSDNLNEILTKLSKAYGKLASGKYSVKNQLKALAPTSTIHGFVRALEVTHGKNGFHPHIHMIVFTDKSVGTGLMQHVYKNAWQRACRLSGLPEPSELHGCNVKDGTYAAEYVSKWGLEDEMTKANTKMPGQKGMTPWGFLRAILDGKDPVYTPEKSKGLFLVYANAFKGRRQLYWSNGLRKTLEMAKEISDVEIVDTVDDEKSTLLATIEFEQWKKIRHKKLEAYILSVAENRPLELNSFILLLCASVAECDDYGPIKPLDATRYPTANIAFMDG